MRAVLDGHLSGRRLSAFVDGELPAAEADRFRAHLLCCAVCTAAVAGERRVRERVRASLVPTPSSELLASLRVVAAGDPAAARPTPPAPPAPPTVAAPPRRRHRGPLVLGVAGVLGTGTAVAVVGLATPVLQQDVPAAPPPAAALGGATTPDPQGPGVVPAGFGGAASPSTRPTLTSTSSRPVTAAGQDGAVVPLGALASAGPGGRAWVPQSSTWFAFTPPRR